MTSPTHRVIMVNHSIQQPLPAHSASFYIERADHIFQHVAQTPSYATTKRFFAFGDQTILLQFAERTSADSLTPALEHLVITQTSRPDLTITVADRISTGREMLPPEILSSSAASEGDSQTNPALFLQTPHIFMSIEPLTGRFNLLDVEHRRGLFWLSSPSHLTLRDRSQPFRVILYWWMRQQKYYLVHAAAVGTRKGGVLIAGKASSGKSTVALACLGSKLHFAGDDHVMAGIYPQPFVYSLYNSATLSRNYLKQNLPHLLATSRQHDEAGDGKELLFVHHSHPRRVINGFPLRAILIPRITGLPKTTAEKTSSAEGLAALAPSTILQLPGAGQEEFKWMARLVQQIPAYRLNVGTDLHEVPPSITGLLERLEG
jgi:hypothetical protein